ncbi:MAG: class I SAM-dependent methyltransferase [Lachnospiraceae bacterium]|nr:class I SAM-dependent methyltransferase [Lachnospiraceae bacterium]
MANLNIDNYSGNDVYNDGNIEELLLRHYKDGEYIDFNSDEAFYLTTNIRSNILNWYPFNKKDDVLEVGCGCGTLTDLLCNKCGTVHSIDGSKRRAEITYERNKKHDNLYVYAGNFAEIELERKFDYIILIGVFEYAKWFYEVDPFNTFMQQIVGKLKTNGKILLAIENRYGLKYWAGANEDHIRKPYVGLSGYDHYSVSTFGKSEIEEIFSANGISKVKYFYPYPDYKLPLIIYSDERLPKQEEIKDLPFFTYGNNVQFDLNLCQKGLLENNQFGFFSNSFLIEAGGKDATLSNVIYAKLQSGRKEKYQIATVEDNTGVFHKYPLNSLSKQHIKNIMDIYQDTKNILKMNKMEMQNEGLLIEKVYGESVCQYINRMIKEKNIIKIQEEFQKMYDYIKEYSTLQKNECPIDDEIIKMYGKDIRCICNGLMDFNVSNFVRINDEYITIDQEWKTDFQVPIHYAIYSSVMWIFGHTPEVKKFIDLNDILESFGLDEKKRKLMKRISEKYFDEVKEKKIFSKINLLEKYVIENESKPSIVEMAVFYFDYGNGYNEEDKAMIKYEIQKNIYSTHIEIPKGVKILRFDPCLVGKRMVKYSDLLIDKEKTEYKENNITTVLDYKIFNKSNPYFEFQLNKNSITVEIKMDYLTEIEQLEVIDTLIGNSTNEK